jgi:hypothetical protein
MAAFKEEKSTLVMGPLLFTLAVMAIVIGPVAGLVWGSSRIIVYRLRGLDLSPPVSAAARSAANEKTIDLTQPSVLTRRRPRGTMPDPLVCIDGVDYRITRVGESRYLVTERRESRRIGFFELVGDAALAEIAPEPDEAKAEPLLVRIAVAASRRAV